MRLLMLQVLVMMAVRGVRGDYVDHYQQYRDPAESSTTETTMNPSVAEYQLEYHQQYQQDEGEEGVGSRGRRQGLEGVKESQEIKKAVQEILAGHDIDEVLKSAEESPTSSTRSVGTKLGSVTSSRDVATRSSDVATPSRSTPDDWTTTTPIDDMFTGTETVNGAVKTEQAAATVDSYTQTYASPPGGFRNVPEGVSSVPGGVIRSSDTQPPTRSPAAATPHCSPTTTAASTTVNSPPSTVVGATAMAVSRADDAEYYLDAEPATTAPTVPAGAALRVDVVRTTRRYFDIPMFLEIIKNLTEEYDMNLTEQVNETLVSRWSIGPTCPNPNTTSTTPHSTTVHEDMDYGQNMTGTIMGKCFVCGLHDVAIPMNARCADAFAGDFLPLVPVDPTARGKIGYFRKYCRFMDVPNMHFNESDPRSLWGRWTGGCSVRWVDLTGVYTQRTCRNRHRAVTGRHYASKRMAKLEMALQHLDNGCIISPVASLLPLSRGVNLYARFHACVCTGNWCNIAHIRSAHSMLIVGPLLALLLQ